MGIASSTQCNKCSTGKLKLSFWVNFTFEPSPVPDALSAAWLCSHRCCSAQLRLQDWLLNKSRPHELSQSCEQLKHAIVWGDGTMCSSASVSVLLTTRSARGHDEPFPGSSHSNNKSWRDHLLYPLSKHPSCTSDCTHTEWIILNLSHWMSRAESNRVVFVEVASMLCPVWSTQQCLWRALSSAAVCTTSGTEQPSSLTENNQFSHLDSWAEQRWCRGIHLSYLVQSQQKLKMNECIMTLVYSEHFLKPLCVEF